MLVSTLVNFTNPTNYSVTVPFVDLLILYNDTAVAHVTAQNISVGPGNNSYVPIDFFWCPSDAAGVDGIEAGRALLSSYVSSQFLLGGIEPQLVDCAEAFTQVLIQQSPSKAIETRFHLYQTWAKHYQFSTLLFLSLAYLFLAAMTRTQSPISSKMQRYVPFTHTASLQREKRKLSTNTNSQI
jgi:hypothetical protein